MGRAEGRVVIVRYCSLKLVPGASSAAPFFIELGTTVCFRAECTRRLGQCHSEMLLSLIQVKCVESAAVHFLNAPLTLTVKTSEPIRSPATNMRTTLNR